MEMRDDDRLGTPIAFVKYAAIRGAPPPLESPP